VGLAVDDVDELAALIERVEPDSRSLGRAGPVDVRRWEDPSGARLVWGQREGEPVEFLPSFAALPSAHLRGISFVSDVVATADVVDDETGEQTTAMALEFEERRFLQGRRSPRSGAAALTALGIEVEVFDDDESFAASTASLLSEEDAVVPREPPAHVVAGGLPWPIRVSSESFFSYGVFAQDDAKASAHARLAGTVVQAATRTVTVTGQRFVAARVASVGFGATVCFPADQVTTTPRAGNIIHGTVFLVGSIEVPAPRRRWPFGR
jgi:hypothetical protein